jgi:hypothetical protein
LRDSHPKRPETAASYGPESPTHEGIPTEKEKVGKVDFEIVNAEKVFRDNVEKSWLKQLKVAISTGASSPEKIKSTKFENKFCRLARRRFKIFQKFVQKYSS